MEKFQKLKSFYLQLFPEMTDENWDKCAAMLKIRKIKKRDYYLKVGEVCNTVAFVNSGLVRMYYELDDKEKIICFIGEHQYVSEYQSFLTRHPSMIYIQALEDLELVETSYQDLQHLYSTMPEANIIGRLIAEQLFVNINATGLLERMESIEQRYLRLIEEQPELLQKVPQYMIASYLGITPEAFSRVKARMNKDKKPASLSY
jgi:CRP-like cAMP-binding protein